MSSSADQPMHPAQRGRLVRAVQLGRELDAWKRAALEQHPDDLQAARRLVRDLLSLAIDTEEGSS